MTAGKKYPSAACGEAEMARFEARFLAGRARLAFSPPGSWPRSPQRGLMQAARKETRP